MLDSFATWSTWGPSVLRVVAGVTFITYGYAKLFSPRMGPVEYARILRSVGFAPPLFWAYVGGVVQFFGGILLVVGFLTRLTALVYVVSFIVFMIRAKGSTEFRMTKDHWAWHWMMLAVVVSLLLTGPGAAALDHHIMTGL